MSLKNPKNPKKTKKTPKVVRVEGNQSPIQNIYVSDIYFSDTLEAAIRNHAKNHYNLENIDFLFALRPLLKFPITDSSLAGLHALHKKFIATDSSFQININETKRKAFEEAIKLASREKLSEKSQEAIFEALINIQNEIHKLVRYNNLRDLEKEPEWKKIRSVILKEKYSNPLVYLRDALEKQDMLKKIKEDGGYRQRFFSDSCLLTEEQMGPAVQAMMYEILKNNKFPECFKPPLTKDKYQKASEAFAKWDSDLTNNPEWDNFWK